MGCSTDIDGNFTLKVGANVKRLKVSYVGMKTAEVDITSDKMIIKLDDAENRLDEVMVVAYGTATKEAFTGSAAVIDASQIEKSQVSNALNALNSKVVGVQLTNASGAPGTTTPTIRIRGISSINANNAPLVIVDGAPFSGDMNTINSQDIASMTVLKDAASNALYGARGANGVILITTKKGQLGSGATVTVDAKWGQHTCHTGLRPHQGSPSVLRGLLQRPQPLRDGQDAAQLAGGLPVANQNLTAANDYGLWYQTYTAPQGQYLVGENGKFNPAATKGYMRSYRGEEYWMEPDNWLDASYKNSLRQEYNMSVSNGTDQTSFYASVGFLNNEGITPNTGFKRFTGRLSADTRGQVVAQTRRKHELHTLLRIAHVGGRYEQLVGQHIRCNHRGRSHISAIHPQRTEGHHYRPERHQAL